MNDLASKIFSDDDEVGEDVDEDRSSHNQGIRSADSNADSPLDGVLSASEGNQHHAEDPVDGLQAFGDHSSVASGSTKVTESTAKGTGKHKPRGRPAKDEKSVESLSCRWDSCTRTYGSAKEARAHERVHISECELESVFACRMRGCGREFATQRQLRKHFILHQPKAYSCETCGKGFHDSNKLARHEKVHTGDKPFCCEECGMKFGERGNLKTHMRVHSGERPFVCPIDGCSKRFAQACNRNTHLQTHYKKADAFEVQASSAAASINYLPSLAPSFLGLSFPSVSSSAPANGSTNSASSLLNWAPSSNVPFPLSNPKSGTSSWGVGSVPPPPSAPPAWSSAAGGGNASNLFLPEFAWTLDFLPGGSGAATPSKGNSGSSNKPPAMPTLQSFSLDDESGPEPKVEDASLLLYLQGKSTT